MTSGNPMVVTGFVGVYHADGGAVGEARYVIGKLLGTTHCGLCDVTHGPVRRKQAWDEVVRRLGVPFELLHLNEMSAQVSDAVAEHGAPLVLAGALDGSLHPVMTRAALDDMGGSVPAFDQAIRAALAGRGWRLAAAANPPI